MTSTIIERGIHISGAWAQHLTCPRCRSPLISGEQKERSLRCQRCYKRFVVLPNGIPSFVAGDDFYEEHGFVSTGRSFGSDWLGRMALWFARHHYLHDVTKHVPAGSMVIEIGCGGGSRYLQTRYGMLGVEISSKAAASAARTYDSVIQATTGDFPLNDGCAEAVISSYTLEHLDGELIARSLAEMHRVLTQNGIMIHCFDLDSSNPFYRWVKRRPWFEEIFVSERGHHGLRPYERWRALFDTAGFQILEARLFSRTWLQDPSVWAYLDHPEVHRWPRLVGKAASWFRRIAGPVSDVMMTVFDDITDRFFEESRATRATVALRKR